MVIAVAGGVLELGTCLESNVICRFDIDDRKKEVSLCCAVLCCSRLESHSGGDVEVG